MKYLGIDYGKEALGLAVSDRDGMIAFPKEEIKNGAGTLDRILQIMETDRIDAIVIGDTRALNGKANAITPEADRFADLLVQKGVRVERIWEAWSTFEAARFAPEKDKHNNAAAAAVILQRYLDTHQPV